MIISKQLKTSSRLNSHWLVAHVLSHLPSSEIISLATVSKLFHQVVSSKGTHKTGFRLTPNYKPKPHVPTTHILSGHAQMDNFEFSKIRDCVRTFSLADVPPSQRQFVCSLVKQITLFKKHTNIRYALPNLKHKGI